MPRELVRAETHGPRKDEAPRLFFAVELADSVRSALGRIAESCRSRDAGGYRWVEQGLMHVTLAFLGSQPAEALPRLAHAARNVAAPVRPFWLGGGEPGAFGPRHTPRVLWLGVTEEHGELTRLQDSLVARLRDSGVNLEDRPFRAHVTLARRREGARTGSVPWPPSTLPKLRWLVQDFVLMRSELGPRGPRYTLIERFSLGARQ